MFSFGASSERHLTGVDPRLERIARRALALSTVDFSIIDGLRTQTEQDELVKNGASKKRDSFHLTGHALDVWPWIAGKARPELEPMLQVAIAWRESSIYFSEPVIWGGVWDRRLAHLNPANLMDEITLYRRRYAAAHGPDAHPLFDPWHFQVRR